MSSLLFLFTVVLLWIGNSEAVTRYTTSTADGAISTGTCPDTGGSRCTNARALSLSSAGDVVVMLGNTMASPREYKGANDMLAAGGDGGGLIAGKSGTAGNEITVRCSVAGGCLINGEFVRVPLRMSSNSYWIFEDFNVKNSSTTVIYLVTGNNNNTFRRIVAWDSPIDKNNDVAQVIGSANNLFEDFAAFGTGRKILTPYGSSTTNTICRRCWFRWEGTTFGSALGASLIYLSNGTIYENVLITWSGESMPNNYTVPPPSFLAGTAATNFEVVAPVAILSIDRIDASSTPKLANAAIRGSISYTKATDRLPTGSSGGVPGGTINGIALWGASNITLTDVIRVMANTHSRFDQHIGIGLVRRPQNCITGVSVCEDPVTGNSALRLTSVRGTKTAGGNTGDSFGTLNVSGYANETDWSVTHQSVGNCVGSSASSNLCSGTHVTAVQTPWQNTSTDGARLCYQYGTTTPLWPWPMNDRILAATGYAGAYSGTCTTNCKNLNGTAFTFPARTATDVTADIEALLGTIPQACLSTTPPTTFPDATGFNPASLSTF